MKILAITPCGKHDYLTSVVIEGLKKLNIELYCTDTGNGAINLITDEQFINHYQTCDYIFVFWSKSIFNGIPAPKFYLIDQVSGWDKTVYIDGSEYNYTGYPGKVNELLHPVFLKKSKWYFKRECLSEHVLQNIIPLPFSAVESDFLNIQEEKTIDVLCSFGQTSTGKRKIAIEACNDLQKEGYNIITDHVDNYFNKVHQAWITIDAHGGGECNARMWQIMANQSCLFAEKYNIVYPNLTDGKHYISWESKEDLKDKLRNYLGNKEKLSYIIQDSYSNIIQHHTSVERVKYIFDKIKLEK